ncbi:glycoside hydrolase family 3 N-terminal domain-containing protein [Pigmentibacter sp. JX0631]|uniref:glycoside hydrolase family 3 N-terminal domain-containing protein n=1 Tax=Pigmentibacter sp. JX0631 TaxID=2976982 RepID=UPI00246985F3|nr:glycoside hydrolase family 3 N-terminal domain-containing protein [Pigmentibacter sp. JX0631]WGL59967.1 glycoside hydrolase family 3 N-terminal domain-containing protein [Pigmentibacter sp. JX0631]
MSPKERQSIPKKFEKYFYSLPLIEQAGFFLWPSLNSIEIQPEEKKLLNLIKPSGVILFKRNLQSFAQARNLIQTIKKVRRNKKSSYNIPFITSIDEEGGRVSRLPPPFIRGKPALEFAELNDLNGLESQILHQIFVAKNLGINSLLSPVVDILTEPSNLVIGDRCFGRTPEKVTKFASFVNKILLTENMYSCAKHFPGHGNTTTDSHKELSVSNVTLDVLRNREWIPFKNLIAENVPFIITAHVLIPEIDQNNPATLSKTILAKYLRKELGFKGLIISDDLRMNAIAEHYNQKRKIQSSITENNNISIQEEDDYLKQAAIDALKAGCDILLSCQSIVREAKIAYAIANKMQKDKLFHNLMLEKAWNIFSTLTKKQKMKA